MSSRMRRRRRPGRARQGFTVIEMIIAIMVMSIGIMGLAGTARYVAMQMGNGRSQTIAATFATANRGMATIDSTEIITITMRISGSVKPRRRGRGVRRGEATRMRDRERMAYGDRA